MYERIQEPGSFVVRARGDVRASRRSERGKPYYFLEDSLRGTYYRLGEAEFALFDSLNGVCTLDEAVAKAAAKRPDDALNLDHALALSKWLLEVGLVYTAESTSTERVQGKTEIAQFGAWKRWSPWFIRWTWGSADRLIEKFQPLGAILFSRLFFVVWLGAFLSASVIVVGNWSEMSAHSPLELGLRGTIALLIIWSALKLLHEAGHALACRHVGCKVGSVGIMFVLGIPSPFVDVSSTWRRNSRADRVLVALAGVYLEAFIASLAMLVWAWSSDDATHQLCLATAMVAGVSTLVFNLNPLMRFDGYFAFSDAIDFANLSSRAAAAAGRFLQRYLLGVEEPEAIRRAGPEPRWLAVFGLAAMAWRGFVTFGLLSLALYKFGPVAAGLLSVLPAIHWLRGLRRIICEIGSSATIRFRLRRATWSWCCVAVIGGIALWWCDPREIDVPAVVDYEPLTVVRTRGPGFVREVFVQDGDFVNVGRPLVRIENKELTVELEQTKLQIQQHVTKARVHRQAGELAKEQAETIRRQSLEVKLTDLEKRSANQVITAPVAGRIVSRGISQLSGRWLTDGSDVVVLGTESAKHVVAALSQEDSESIPTAGDGYSLRITGSDRIIVPISLRADPRASCELIHPALSVEHGGELPIRRRDTTSKATDAQKTMIAEFYKPHFRLTAGLAPDIAEPIFAGRTGVLRIRTTWLIAFGRVWARFDRWLDGAPRNEAE
ncbi:MAG: hypothetical protein K8U03_08795 [Planctomycetia bacterium]|nr:hypothetical protein [Planctomycetia bacterium]